MLPTDLGTWRNPRTSRTTRSAWNVFKIQCEVNIKHHQIVMSTGSSRTERGSWNDRSNWTDRSYRTTRGSREGWQSWLKRIRRRTRTTRGTRKDSRSQVCCALHCMVWGIQMEESYSRNWMQGQRIFTKIFITTNITKHALQIYMLFFPITASPVTLSMCMQ